MEALSYFMSLLECLPLASKGLYLTALLIIVLAHWRHLRSQDYTLPLLVISCLLMASAFALIDPFFHTWDESFHALVAKNTSENYLKPHLLNEELFSYNYEIWVGNYVWLHKPPLALWQMALSLDLFGNKLIAVRLPSILAFGATCFFVYKIGFRLFNRHVAYYAGLLFILYQFGLEQVSGIHTADHIDVSFTLYTTASFWAWISYHQEKRTRYLLMIGLFAGLAVLTKWLTGLVIFGVWGTYLLTLFVGKKECILPELLSLLKALGVALVLFMPWNIYAAVNYPKEYWHEFNYARRHFSEVIELHGGDGWFYWDNLSTLFGSGTLTPWIVLLAVISTIFLIKERRDRIALFVFIIAPYVFFTIAATKMSNFVSIVSPAVLISIAAFFVSTSSWIIGKTNLSNYWSLLVLPFLFVFLLRPKETFKNHNFDEQWRRTVHQETQSFIKLLNTKNEEVYFYIDTHHYEHIKHMFYHDNLALSGVPSDQQLKTLRSEKRPIVIIYSDERPDATDYPEGTRFISMPDMQRTNLKI